jgi:hypothetical protein
MLCAFVAIETFAAVHPLDLVAHANGETCKICVSAAGLGNAVAAEVQHCALEPAPTVAVAVREFPCRSAAPVRQTARGPPLPS